MSLIDLLLRGIAPYNCLACGAEGRLLCEPCLAKVPALPGRCYRCCVPSPGWRTCDICLPKSRLRSVRVAATYDGYAKDLVWRLKLGGARSAAEVMAERMAPLTSENMRPVIVPVPTATGRARRRGYDQAKLLARSLALQTRLDYLDCLARQGQSHQHGLTRRQRLEALTGAFRVKSGLVRNAQIILVDDVVTTGATLEAAGAALLKSGAGRVDAVVFAQPDK